MKNNKKYYKQKMISGICPSSTFDPLFSPDAKKINISLKYIFNKKTYHMQNEMLLYHLNHNHVLFDVNH
jgi:hypothetical protein